MPTRGTELLEEIMTWPSRDRAEFAEQILSTLDKQYEQHIQELCLKEVKDRLDAYERGEMTALTGDEAIAWLNGLGKK